MFKCKSCGMPMKNRWHECGQLEKQMPQEVIGGGCSWGRIDLPGKELNV